MTVRPPWRAARDSLIAIVELAHDVLRPPPRPPAPMFAWFDVGIARIARATWRTFAYPVHGYRLYFRCGCRRRAGVFPWVEQRTPPYWDVLDGLTSEPLYHYRRVCDAHRELETRLVYGPDGIEVPA